MALGYDYNPDFNVQQSGVGPYQFTIKSDTDCCCLPCAHSKASQFDCNNWALVTRLLFEGAVEYLHSGMLHQVRVDREVCGARSIRLSC